MCLKIAALNEAPVTEGTLVVLRLCMYFDMRIQVSFLGEIFATCVALVGSLATMGHKVGFKVSFLCKVSVTHVALESLAITAGCI